MRWARDNSAAVLTGDLDFGVVLSASGAPSPSVIQLRPGALSPKLIGDRLLAALKQLENDLEAGCLITLNINNTPITILPITRDS